MAEDKKGVTLTQEQFDALMGRLNKLENTEQRPQTTTRTNESGVDAAGKPIGIISKYSIDPAYYEDPRERLYNLPELARFAFKENFILDWLVKAMVYETKYGTTMSVPKFYITVKQKRYDQDGNQLDSYIIRQRGIFKMDPQACIQMALEMDMPIDKADTREFMDEMRFMEMKRWLIEVLSPRRPTSTKLKSNLQVISGIPVEIEEFNTVIQ